MPCPISLENSGTTTRLRFSEYPTPRLVGAKMAMNSRSVICHSECPSPGFRRSNDKKQAALSGPFVILRGSTGTGRIKRSTSEESCASVTQTLRWSSGSLNLLPSTHSG